MSRMNIALLAALTLILSACAPSTSMIATLTMLPATLTPARPTPIRTQTSLPPATPAAARTETSTPIPCPPANVDTTHPLPKDAAGFVGRTFDQLQLPKALKLDASGLLASNDYSWARLEWQGQAMMWVQKLVCRTNSGKPYWQVVDALQLPTIDPVKNETTTDLCFNGEQQIPFAIAYGTFEPAQPTQTVNNFSGWPMQVKNAWQMKDRFVPLDPTGLTCLVQDQGGH